MSDDNGSGPSFAKGLIVGLALGLAVGLLYAPQAGKETRALIREKTKNAAEKGKEILGEARERATKIIADAKGKTAEN